MSAADLAASPGSPPGSRHHAGGRRSHDAAQLIASRAFQGIGVGGLQALVQVAIAAMIPPKDRGRYNGYLGGVMALATVGGPLLGGVIVDTSWLGWRWCFLVGGALAQLALIP